jgi:hypothetical protein
MAVGLDSPLATRVSMKPAGRSVALRGQNSANTRAMLTMRMNRVINVLSKAPVYHRREMATVTKLMETTSLDFILKVALLTSGAGGLYYSSPKAFQFISSC